MEALQAGDPPYVGAYRLMGRLGAGGMGRVFLGVSPGGRNVAVKLMLPEHSADKEFRQRFAREVAAARQVGGFHTAPVVDADPDADPPWMVTAYIPGPSLDAVVRSAGPLDPSAMRALGAGLAEGLAAVHAAGLVHRDLKPSNGLLREFCEGGYAGWRITRLRRRGKLARPYVCRLVISILLTLPSMAAEL